MPAPELLTFGVGGEVFAVPLEAVSGVGLLGALVVPPAAPAFLRGIANRGGELLPVLDLQLLLGQAADARQPTAEPPAAWLVVLRDGRLTAGLIAHREPNIVQMDDEAPLPDAQAPTERSVLVRGYITPGGEGDGTPVALLDPAAVLRAATIGDAHVAQSAGAVA